VATLIQGGALGWSSLPTLGLGVLAVLCIAAFFVIEKRSSHPMLPLAIFRRHAFTASITNGFAFQFGGYGMQFMLAIFVAGGVAPHAAQDRPAVPAFLDQLGIRDDRAGTPQPNRPRRSRQQAAARSASPGDA